MAEELQGKIKDFLELLATDPDIAEEFEETPVGVMVEKGRLPKEKRDLILTGSIQAIREEVMNEDPDAAAGDPVYVIRVKHG